LSCRRRASEDQDSGDNQDWSDKIFSTKKFSVHFVFRTACTTRSSMPHVRKVRHIVDDARATGVVDVVSTECTTQPIG